MVIRELITIFLAAVVGMLITFTIRVGIIKKTKADPIPYLWAGIGYLWSSYGLFLLFKHIKISGLDQYLGTLFGIWLLFVVGLRLKHLTFAEVDLTAIVWGLLEDLLALLLMGMIIASFFQN